MASSSSGGASSAGTTRPVNPFSALNLDSIDDDPFSRSRKRRSTDATVSSVPNLEVAQLADGLRFVAIIDLAKLDPNWGTGLHANRSLVDRHVDALVDQIVQSDRRYEPANRCQSSAPDAVIAQLLEKVDIKAKGKLKNYQASKPIDLIVLDVPSNVITLEAGQHRRAAVLRLNELPIHSSTGVFLSKDLEKTKMTTMWPVEVYSKEFLDKHPFAQLRLQYNSDSTKYKSSFGHDMAVIYKAWSAIDEKAKAEYLSSKKKFVNFLNRLLPSNTSLTSWLPSP